MPVAVTPNAIPPAYAKFGVTRGFHPKPFNRLNWLIKSRGGWGKSTFVSSIPGCLHLDIEGGAHSVINNEAVRIPDHARGLSKDQVAEVVSQLLVDGKAAGGDTTKLPFQAIAFDTIDAYVSMLSSDFCTGNNPTKQEYECLQEYGTKGAGYGLVYARVNVILTALEGAGYATVLTCHEKEKDIEVMEGGKPKTVTVVRAVVGDSLAKALENRADIAAVIRPTSRTVEGTKFIEIGGVKKEIPDGQKKTIRGFVMQVECSTQYDAKHRIPLFKGSIPLPLQHGWAFVEQLYNEKVAEVRKLLEAGGPLPTE
jgi:hypothetical protein